MFRKLYIVLLLLLSNLHSQDKLQFSHTRGFYNTPFELQITSEVPGAKIKYTLNGSNPLNSAAVYESASPAVINIDPANITNRDKAPGFIITACAVNADTPASKIVTHTYLFINKIVELSPDDLVPGSGWLVPGTSAQQISYGLDHDVYNNAVYKTIMEKAFTSIPTLSIVTDLNNLFNPDSGIYVNAFEHGEEWERAVSLELLNPDSTKGFQINCGLRIRGGWSRHTDNPKHAFRLFFREEYGKGTLNYPLFGDEGAQQFDKFDIQTAQNYSWSYYGDDNNTFLREIFSRDTQRDMGQPYTRGKFYHLYINGTYFGLYQIQERSEESFASSYFGGSQEDYDVIKVDVGRDFNLYNIEATSGTMDKWRELWDAGQQSFSSDPLYFKVQGLNVDGTRNYSYEKLLDVDNLIDYMICTFFVGDFDGPISNFSGNTNPNNFYAVYNRVNPDGFKFFRHDAEHSLFYHDWGTDRTGHFTAGSIFQKSNPQWIHQKLSENPHYRLRFADRVYKHFYNGGTLTLQENINRINRRKQEIEYAIIAESARWGDSKISPPRTKVHWLNAVNFITNTYLPGRNSVVINQLINKQLFSNNQPPQFSQRGGIVEKGYNLTLTSGNGKIYYTSDGSDPYIPHSDTNSVFSRTVINAGTEKKVYVPKSATDTLWKSNLNYNVSGWLTTSGAPGGVGYENGSGYESLISLSVKSSMHESGSSPNNTCYIRIPFQVDFDLAGINNMKLEILYDDGFAAYLNGVKVAQSNAPDNLVWNSAAPSYTEAESYESFDLSTYINLLKPGTNLLAIQGLNNSPSSSDFLILPKLTVSRTTSAGGEVAPGAIEYNSPIQITKTVTIKARSLMGSIWSPLNEAQFIIDEDLSSLRLSELHYHPLDQDTIDDKYYEFIELKNTGQNALSLNGTSFVSGLTYTFGDKSLQSGEIIVLGSNKERFVERYGFEPYDIFTGQLDNSGEKIAMVNAAGDTVFSLIYNDKLPWPEEADGTGYSLVPAARTGEAFYSDPAYWRKSSAIHGSPGADDLATDVENTVYPVTDFRLMQNYPNPFNPATIIYYQIPSPVHVKLVVYDMLGQQVTVLVNSFQQRGSFRVEFDASGLAGGVYFYRIEAGNFIQTRKMMLVK